MIIQRFQTNCESVDVRHALPEEFFALAQVMYDAVRLGDSAYTEEQRSAWVPEVRRDTAWSQRLHSQTVFVAEREQLIIGFITITQQGYVDLAFVRPEYQRTGVLRCLYEVLETHARASGLGQLTVHASLMARFAFESFGFQIVREETVTVSNVQLSRFEMQKVL